ncbi:MalY/PatB family protein [Microbacterium sp.]|uniref:MalY/PatB family protein n=1 Tax=Microbacterium sp. TaxID=51671 RepID=UPI0039E42B36
MDDGIDFDAITIERLREIGSVKWSVFPDAIGAFVAEMDFGVAPPIAEALHASIDDGLFGYLPRSLSVAMSEACASWQADTYGWDVSADRVHPLPDVLKALELAIVHFTAPGSKVILPTPAYMPFLRVPPSLGREILEVPMRVDAGRYGLDLDAVDAAFRDGGELLILCNPYNPVGRVFTRDELAAVCELVDRHGGRVFSDEIHAPLVYAGRRHVPYASISDAAAAHTITATSASKSWNLPGLKCAQLILSNDADARAWEQLGPMAGHGASNLGVIANTVAYTSGRPWLERVIAYNDANRHALAELLVEHIPGIRYTPPEGTYIAWLDCRGLGLDNPAQFFREQAGVALTDGLACGAPGAGFVRFVFATPRPIVERAVRQMADALARRG